MQYTLLCTAAEMYKLDNLRLQNNNLTIPSAPRCVSLCFNLCPRLVPSVLEAMRDASAAALLETHACVKIQSAVRMWLKRTVYRRVRITIIHIQRFYRGCRMRKYLYAQLAMNEKVYQEAIFSYYATRIQACFRGHYCRLHISSYYAVKRYVKKVAQESHRIQRMAESVQTELEEKRRVEAEEADAAAYRRATEQVHHLLSTSVIPGVYGAVCSTPCSPGSSTKNGMLTTIWNTKVESDIKNNNSHLVRTVVLQRQQKLSNSRGTLSLPNTKCESNGVFEITHNKSEENNNEGKKGLMLPALVGSGICQPTSEAPADTDIRDSSDERAARAHYYRQCFKPSIRAQMISCSCEREDIRPPARPLLLPHTPSPDQHASLLTKSGLHNAENGLAVLKRDRVSGNHLAKEFASFDSETECKLHLLTAGSPLAPPNTVSSRNRKFCVPAHDCYRDIVRGGDNGHGGGFGGSDLYLPNRPIYDTEKEALQRIVNMKVIYHLHGDAPFKVSTAVSNGTKTPTLSRGHNC